MRRVSRRVSSANSMWETGRLGLSYPGRPAPAAGFTGRPREVWRAMLFERRSVNVAAGKGDFAMRSCDTSPGEESGLHAWVPNLYPECRLSTRRRCRQCWRRAGANEAVTADPEAVAKLLSLR